MRTIRTQAFVISLGSFLVNILSPCGPCDKNLQERTLETVKSLAAQIDQYIKDHGEADRKFIARRYHADESRKQRDIWEWKEVKYWDEADAFFRDYFGFGDAGVHIRNESVVYVATEIWSESGDWYFYVNYYYDDEGRLLQITADFRGSPDYIKVLDSQYFNESGGVIGRFVEYYDLDTGQKLSAKPHLEREPHGISVYLRVSDLPFYSILKVGLLKRYK